MGVLLLRYFLFFYFLGVFILIVKRLSNRTKNKKGVLAVILFPLMLLTKKGRETLEKGK